MTDTFRVRLLAQHLKLAFRVLRNAPAFSSLVIAILALGIGANTAVFSAIDAVLLRQLPYGDPTVSSFYGRKTTRSERRLGNESPSPMRTLSSGSGRQSRSKT
jgi:hypothetical protein